MANKFISLEDAAAQLGLTKERLNELRESGELRGYRDGPSFKFRTDDITKLASESASLDASQSDELTLGDDLDLTGGAAFSDLDLESLDEPTVPADPEPADDDFGAGIEPLELADDDNDSILLSENELGDSTDRPPSTIIGRSQLTEEASQDDLDLDLTIGDDGPGMSDVRLDEEEVDDLISGPGKSAAADKFENLEELDIDLEAESSRILEAQDVAAAQAAAKQMQDDGAKTDAPSAGSSFSLDLEDLSGSDAGATGVLDPSVKPNSDAFSLASDDDEPLELDLIGSGSDLGSGEQKQGSAADLKDDTMDDLVLDSSDEEGFTLSSADSGINLSPSDSGLALDDGSFPSLGGSVVGSSIDLGEGSEVSLEGSTAFASSPDFNLQPAEELDSEDEEDSSQIIALDSMEEVEEDDGVMINDAASFAGAGAAAGAMSAPTMSQEAAFPIWIVALLGTSSLVMIGSAIMATDLLRSMWAWDQPFSLNSPLIEGFLGLIGLNK